MWWISQNQLFNCVNSITGVFTQNIESCLSQAKLKLNNMRGIRRNQLDLFLK
ncbi:hypothetical protein AAJ76_6100021583 [Vairimorpha ceranae]|uniref:Uncharacterized protein n=1 Tax=Vairimorpha ceranae TaxID=40302 RepID=A0A0F9YPH3_9MICR|nr:hypothetical protein AAJ76_6100021583 [Vairimorpha ceranae]KKO74547.1 hypothetical protein AAJ76_6100021583 [Vairimorpha ceranae]